MGVSSTNPRYDGQEFCPGCTIISGYMTACASFYVVLDDSNITDDTLDCELR